MQHGLNACYHLAIYVARHMANQVVGKSLDFAVDGRRTLEAIMNTRRDVLQA